MGSTCLCDEVGYLLIETVGRGETATKIGEGANIALPSIFISGMFAVSVFFGAYCESKALTGRRQKICKSLKVIIREGNDST